MRFSASILKLAILLGTLAIAIASPTPQATITVTSPPPQPTDCSTGSLQCCDSVVEAAPSSPLVDLLLGLLGVVLQNYDVPFGVTCSPVDGPGGSSCSNDLVCCDTVISNGLIGIGCTPA